MKRWSTVFVVAALLGSSNAVAAGKQDFTVVNQTGYDIDEIYVSPSKSNDWEDDVMGRDVLANGQSVEIEFSKRENACSYDLKVVYSDQDEAEWENFDLCTVSSITLHYSRKSGDTWADYE